MTAFSPVFHQVLIGAHMFESCVLRCSFRALVFFSLTCIGPLALADVLPNATRIVYPEAKRDISFAIVNVGSDNAALAQMWIDAGDPNANPEDIEAPFSLSPPLARVAANARQTVRITYTGETSNLDQESLYWFNVLEIPFAFKGSADADRVTFLRRNRIKLFFRPKGLKGDLQQAFKQMQCGVKNTEGAWVLECHNLSRFHLSFGAFALGNESEKVQADEEGGMLKPLQRMSFALKNYDKLPRPLSIVVFHFINDFGGITPVEYSLAAR